MTEQIFMRKVMLSSLHTENMSTNNCLGSQFKKKKISYKYGQAIEFS